MRIESVFYTHGTHRTATTLYIQHSILNFNKNAQQATALALAVNANGNQQNVKNTLTATIHNAVVLWTIGCVASHLLVPLPPPPPLLLLPLLLLLLCLFASRCSLFALRASFFLYTSLPFRFRFHLTFIVLHQEQERFEKGTKQQPYYQTTHEQRALRSAHYTVKHSIFIAYVWTVHCCTHQTEHYSICISSLLRFGSTSAFPKASYILQQLNDHSEILWERCVYTCVSLFYIISIYRS